MPSSLGIMGRSQPATPEGALLRGNHAAINGLVMGEPLEGNNVHPVPVLCQLPWHLPSHFQSHPVPAADLKAIAMCDFRAHLSQGLKVGTQL